MLVKKKQESSLAVIAMYTITSNNHYILLQAVIAMYTITSNNHYILLQAVNIAEPAAL